MDPCVDQIRGTGSASISDTGDTGYRGNSSFQSALWPFPRDKSCISDFNQISKRVGKDASKSEKIYLIQTLIHCQSPLTGARLTVGLTLFSTVNLKALLQDDLLINLNLRLSLWSR